jgi:hypothetical protein
VCADDSDWYRLDLLAEDLLTLDIVFSHERGDLDMVLYGSDCSTALRWGTSWDDNERIVYRVPSSGAYHVWVYGHQGAENKYTMTFAVESSHPTSTPTATVRWRRVYLPLLRRR